MKSRKISVLSTFCYSFSYLRDFFLIFHARDISRMAFLEKTCLDHILVKSQYLRNPRNILHVKINTLMVVLIQNWLGFYILETCRSDTLKKRKCCVAVQTLVNTLENLITYFSSPYGLRGM